MFGVTVAHGVDVGEAVSITSGGENLVDGGFGLLVQWGPVGEVSSDFYVVGGELTDLFEGGSEIRKKSCE